MKLTPAKSSKKAAAATAHIDAITNDMLDTSASELLRRQPAAAGVETISFLERWSTSGTQEIVLHQKEINGERSIWRFVGPSKDLPNMMKHVRAGGVGAAGGKRARRAEDDQGAADEQDDDEIEIEAPRNPRRPAAAAPRPTAGTTRARKAAAAAAAAVVVYGPNDQDPFVTPSTSAQRPSTSSSGRQDLSAPRAPKKARRVPTASSAPAEDSEDDGDATETETTTPRGSKRSTASSTANSSPSVYNNNVTLRRSLRRRREVSELSDSTSTVAASLDDLGSLCGGLDDLGFDVTDRDIDMGRGSIVPRPTASTSRVKIEHEL